MIHLSRRELEAWHAGALDHDRARIIGHLAACAACAEQLAAVERSAPGEIDRVAAHLRQGYGGQEAESAPFRDVGIHVGGKNHPGLVDWRRLGMAAAVVLAVGSVAYYSIQRDGTGPQRGAAAETVTLTAPAGEVSAADASRFTWSGDASLARIVVIDLASGSGPLIDRMTDGNSLELTGAERAQLTPGKTYRWFVEYRDAAGVLHSTATMQFSIR